MTGIPNNFESTKQLLDNKANETLNNEIFKPES